MNETLLYVTQVAPYDTDPVTGALRLAGAHGVLAQSSTSLAEVAEAAGLAFVHTNDVRRLPADTLADCRVLALFTIGETPWSDSQRGAIETAVRAGRMHLLGVHSATDSCYGWPAYGRLLGARFDGHPWTEDLSVDVVDGGHPATTCLPALWSIRDELYLFKELRPDARVLMRARPDHLDMSRPGARLPEIGLPLAWSFTEGQGRVFYTALGHFPAAYENVVYLAHLYGGLKWLLEGDQA